MRESKGKSRERGFRQVAISVPKVFYDAFAASSKGNHRGLRFEFFIAWCMYRRVHDDPGRLTDFMRDTLECSRRSLSMKRVLEGRYGEFVVRSLYVDNLVADEMTNYFSNLYVPLGVLVKEVLAWYCVNVLGVEV